MYPGWQPMQQNFMQAPYQMVPFQAQSGWMPPQGMPMQHMNMMGMPPGPGMGGPGMGPPGMGPPGPGMGAGQMPPPPGEDNPPLPPDPPPEENAEESELKPKDPLEEQKLQDLKNQAAHWQQTQQIWGQSGADEGSVYQAPAVIDYAHGQSSSDNNSSPYPPARSTPSSTHSDPRLRRKLEDELYAIEVKRAAVELQLLEERVRHEQEVHELTLIHLRQKTTQDECLFKVRHEILTKNLDNALESQNLLLEM